MGPGIYLQTREKCEDCHGILKFIYWKGTGDITAVGDRCPRCKGERLFEEMKEFEIPLDPGAPENCEYLFQDEGTKVV